MATSTVVCVSPLRCALRRLEPRVDEVGVRFFERLLAARPDMIPHFSGFGPARRRRMLLTALLLAIESEEEPGVMERTLRGFGRRHATLALEAEDYEFFGETMRRTLAEALDAAWTPQVEQAWRAAFAKMVQAMSEGQRGGSPSQGRRPQAVVVGTRPPSSTF